MADRNIRDFLHHSCGNWRSIFCFASPLSRRSFIVQNNFFCDFTFAVEVYVAI